MKKIFKSILLFAGASMLFAGCAKENNGSLSGEGEQTVTFTVMAENQGTRAVADDDGNAAKINHWIMEVRDSDGDVYNRQEKDGAEGEKTQTFDVTLIKGQVYDVLFWADTKGTYNTDNLKDVKLLESESEGYAANLDSRDAFSAVEADFTTTTTTSKNIVLKRPFAQLNVIFTDLKKLYETIGNDTEYAKFKPTDFLAKVKLPTSFNVMTQTAGTPVTTALNITAAGDYLDNYDAHADEATLFMDYFFATSSTKDIVDIDFSFVSKGTTIAHSFTSIPFQRNYRTNIKGDLMTSGATFNVTVDPEWYQPDSEEKVTTAGSIAAANEALVAGKNNINIVSPADDTDPIVFTTASNDKEISVNITGASGKKISFKNADDADGPAKLTITADADELDINTPNSHVDILTGTYSKVTAATSATTLVIGKDVTVESLNITAGNVEIHGIVGTIVKPNASVVTYKVETAKVLRNVAAKISAAPGETTFPNIYIENDIDLNNEEWTPVVASCCFTIDGQNHAIKNLKVTDYTGTYIGLFSSVSGATISNLTIQNASLTNAATNGGARGGVLVGWSYACNIDNCHVINANITGSQKVAGILGAMSVEGSAGLNSVTNCSVKNLTMSENVSSDGLYQAGALVGYIQLVNANPDGVLIEKNKVENITINNACGDEGNLPYYCGTFIGSIVNKQQVEGQSIRLNSNTISGTNTALFTSIYSSPYFGWAINAEYYSGALAPILIDGEKWVPDYSFECGGVKYATLDAALAKVSESQDKTVRIIKAGEYKVESLNASNCTVEATVEGVVFNHTPGSHARITGDSNENVIVKNVTWNVGVATYQYYSGTNLENCTVNGIICTRTAASFKNCKFVNETDYNFWIYGTDATFEGCEFTCPGGTKGGALNLYHEGSTTVSNVIVKDCEFTALETTTKYSALYIKPEAPFAVEITNCTANDKFANGAISGSKVWNVKENTNKTTTVTVDGKLVYANGAMLSLSTPAQLVAFAAAVNAGDTFEGKTVYLENDVDMTGIEWTAIGNVNGYPSTTFAGTFDGQNNTIANLTCNSNTAENATAGFFGSVTGDVKNLTMTDVTITSLHFAGAICGYCSTNSSVFENCHVIGGTITSTPENKGSEYDNGDKVGGIVGLSQSGEVIKNCSVENVTIRAYRDLGGICGASGASVTGCSVKNSSIIQDNTNAYKTVIDTYHEIVGRELDGFNESGNTYNNVTVKTEN